MLRLAVPPTPPFRVGSLSVARGPGLRPAGAAGLPRRQLLRGLRRAWGAPGDAGRDARDARDAVRRFGRAVRAVGRCRGFLEKGRFSDLGGCSTIEWLSSEAPCWRQQKGILCECQGKSPWPETSGPIRKRVPLVGSWVEVVAG